jgi:endonuclease III
MTSLLAYQDIVEIFHRFQTRAPEPECELEHDSAFTLLVAVALSAQATDKGVNKATKPLFAVANTPQAILALGEEKLIDYIKTIGLYKNKARNIIKLCQILIDEYEGVVPTSRAALQALPGVGRKTANVVLNVWFKQPVMAVDTHVFRVANRIGLAPGKDVVAVERGLEDVLPHAYALHAHHWLILHGRYVCKARKPECADCLINDLCLFKEKTI